MKARILTLLLFFLSANCFSQEKTNDSIIGKVENGVFISKIFNWSIKIPENYTVTEIESLEKLEKNGKIEIKKNIPENSVIQERINLIGFSLNSKNTFSSGLNSLKGIKRTTLEEHKIFVLDLMKKNFSKFENARFEFYVVDVKIGIYDFYRIKVEAFNSTNNNLVLTQIYYNSFIEEYLFGALINYDNEIEGKMLDDNFINSFNN